MITEFGLTHTKGMDMPREWQTTDGANECKSGCYQERRQEDQELDGWKESRMQWQREDWKDSEWIEKNGNWKSNNVSDVKKVIHMYILTKGSKGANCCHSNTETEVASQNIGPYIGCATCRTDSSEEHTQLHRN
jgi:hypothetical protein